MIDFQKELDKFDFMTLEPEFSRVYNETTAVVEAFTAIVKRIGKELHNTNIQLEELLLQCMEDKEKEKQIIELRNTIAATEEERLSLVQGLISMLDQLEHIYRYALKNEQGNWSEQLQLVWSNTSANLLPLGLIRIEGENTLFDARLHAAVQVKEEINLQNGMILEVLRCGYMYQTNVLRKAHVVVNKNVRGDELNGHHCRD